LHSPAGKKSRQRINKLRLLSWQINKKDQEECLGLKIRPKDHIIDRAFPGQGANGGNMSERFIRSIFISNDGFRWGWELFLFFLITGVTVAVIVGPLLLLLSAIGLSPQIGIPVTGWISIIGSILILAAGYAAFLLGTHLTQRFIKGASLSDLGLKFSTAAVGNFAVGFGLGSIIVVISVLLSWISGFYEFSDFSWQIRSVGILIPALVLALVAKIQPALIEEVIFRGYLFQVISSRRGMRAAVLLSSFLFGLAHLASFDETTTWWMAIISTFLAGLVFAQAYLVRMTLWLPIGIHYAWHIAGRLLGDTGGPAENAIFIVSDVTQERLITSPTGGGAGIFDLIGLGVASLILWRMGKKNPADRS
jgi:membrane protease YdiL (CAAX protease family)